MLYLEIARREAALRTSHPSPKCVNAMDLAAASSQDAFCAWKILIFNDESKNTRTYCKSVSDPASVVV